MRDAGAAEVGVHIDAGRVRIDVSDRGPRIEAEARDRPMQPFQRLEGSRSRETGGAVSAWPWCARSPSATAAAWNSAIASGAYRWRAWYFPSKANRRAEALGRGRAPRRRPAAGPRVPHPGASGTRCAARGHGHPFPYTAALAR
ncbi:hypothetical protein [Luteimonas deserti]|uniref:hypothetical protein n=1 Tax=Luteimonas deserti TaxID=2752306 RepID=UPI003CE4BACB